MFSKHLMITTNNNNYLSEQKYTIKIYLYIL